MMIRSPRAVRYLSARERAAAQYAAQHARRIIILSPFPWCLESRLTDPPVPISNIFIDLTVFYVHECHARDGFIISDPGGSNA